MTAIEKFWAAALGNNSKIATLAKAAMAEYEAEVNEATKKEREACAMVAEAAAVKMGFLGRAHRDNGQPTSMDRCYARALQCTQLAADIRTRLGINQDHKARQAASPEPTK